MITAVGITKVRKSIERAKGKAKRIGFVPTMGALHEGHLSLIRAAEKECDFVVVSIFVNPIQFGPGEDYTKYPRNVKRDGRLLKKEGVDLIFYPSAASMYTGDFSTYVREESLSKALCGASRPGHFQGVCTVVTKLFNIVEPDIAYFGQKDYQQAQVIKRLVNDLAYPLRVRILPIVRERDGLAMSSRNAYLTSRQRNDAAVLYEALMLCKRMIKQGERFSSRVVACARKLIETRKTARIDYVKVVDARTLQEVKRIQKRVLIALAVYVGKPRLIDNIIVRGSS